MPRRLLTGLFLASLGHAALAAAADAPPADIHDTTSNEIVVSAPIQRNRQDVLSGVAILSGEDLAQAIRPTIGETLAHTPGVSSTSFGPNASRPVIRGLQGERVRVLTDGIGSIDVSNTSVDHAVAINPLLAERIEVLRGPESLLYASSAVGGVVNVIDRRIPRAVPTEAAHVEAIATLGSAADERSVSGAVDTAVGGRLVLHADGSYLETGDLRIGGHVLSRDRRAEALANAGRESPDQQADGIDFAGNAALEDRLANSQSRTWTAGAGASIVTDTGHLGLAYSHYDSVYGVPIRYATRPRQEQEAPRLDLQQNRIDARAEVDTGGGIFKTVRARLAHANYRHFELEEDGAVGTAFYNKGMEGRVELVQADRGPWKGASGGQYVARDFDVVGDEAFLPKNRTEQTALFTFQQLDFGGLKIEGAARYEHSILDADPRPGQPQFFDGGRGFSTLSASLGASLGLGGGWRIGGNLLRTDRAPTAEELFANGPHGGTESFEVGDPTLRTERSWGVEAVLRGGNRDFSVEASVYHDWFDRFIYQYENGAIQDGLPVFATGQADARYYGFELQGSATLFRFGDDRRLTIDGLADYVHATVDGFGPAPLIPPLRLLGGVGVDTRLVDGRVEVEWNDRQGRTAPSETETGGFTLVNAALTIRPWGTDRPLSVLLSANNIFDVTARRHASVLKDYAPLAGRDFRATLRASF